MPDVDAVIVGGGPVGLYLGCLLAIKGRTFVILEARSSPVEHSRSIGIHPPLLESMAGIGLADRLIDDAVKIRRGHGYWNGRHIGTLDFSHLPGRYRFVLSLPQTVTERHLEVRLEELAPGALMRGVRVTSVAEEGDQVRVHAERAGETLCWTARIAAGCDGKNSIVREEAECRFAGGAYPDRYVMGDFAESTSLGTNAALCLGDHGLVESFPLPSGERRWVVKRTDARKLVVAEAHLIADAVLERTGWRVDPESASMTSAFGVERFEARPMAAGRIFLAGDAAHVISPIGGQGMNLGWLDADALAQSLDALMSGPEDIGVIAASYALRRARTAGRARRRAEFNMRMGRARKAGPGGAVVSALKAVTARLILVPGIRAACARQFTMHGLDARDH